MTGPTLGARLRAERERRGISLDEVAARTKVSAAMFADMERDDYRRWPPGIFGRSFMRGYAEVVGLNVDDVVRAYLRIQPHRESLPTRRGWRGAAAPSDHAPGGLEGGADTGDVEPTFRLTLAEDPETEDTLWRGSSRRQRRVATLLDLIICGVALTGVLLWGRGLVAVFVAMAFYFAGGTLIAGSSPTLAFVTRRAPRPDARQLNRSAATRSRLSDLLSRVASSRSDVGRVRNGRRSDQLLTMFSRSPRG